MPFKFISHLHSPCPLHLLLLSLLLLILLPHPTTSSDGQPRITPPNCVVSGGGSSPPYSLCSGCNIASALLCISDFRSNVSLNVPMNCDLNSLKIEPQPQCCTEFNTDNVGFDVNPRTSGYNDALKCLQLLNCECSNGNPAVLKDGLTTCSDGEGGKHTLYGSLQRECRMHTEHRDCRNSCENWVHTGAEPQVNLNVDPQINDCNCFAFDSRDSILLPPLWDYDKPGCAAGSASHVRYNTKRFDWWKCWYNVDCVSQDTGFAYVPPTRDGEQAWGEACTASEQADFDAGVANFDCVPEYGVLKICDTSVSVDSSGVSRVEGIFVPAGLLVNEDVNCKVDEFACEPTTSGARGEYDYGVLKGGWSGLLVMGCFIGSVEWL